MSRYRISDQAEADLEEIWLYVAQYSFRSADRLLGEIYDALIKLAEMPHTGHLREDLVEEPLRFWSVRGYMIVYRAETSPVEIVRVVSGRRDLGRLLR
jgi:plasmid stabilization system protein ParE